jgi:EAL domain-containing protein (putative c-di-GMP-specific phosphodiesterase class I)/GGDEF domain-containing protein
MSLAAPVAADVLQNSYQDVLAAVAAEVHASDAALAILLLDVGDTSRLQARLGPGQSVVLLQALGASFAAALGRRGQVMRLGDGRFCALVRASRNVGHAVLAGERLTRAADEFFTSERVAVRPPLAIGVAICPLHGRDAERLLHLAQIASEAARARNLRVLVFDDSCNEQVVTPWELGNEFSQALDTGSLSVYYQPKIAIATGLPTGVESLMRWLEGSKPVASPDVFIPLAAEAGLIAAATWYSLSNSLRTSAELDNLPVAVNVAPQVLHHREFIDMVRTAAATWRLREGNLTLEVTEGALIADLPEATRRLSLLRDMGIRISIDDFGTGYSSLSYFKKIPADELKIDKSFIRGLTTDTGDQRLVSVMIELARHFNLTVVAEGVEDQPTFDMLAQLGCQYAQGYLFAPALSRAHLDQWLTLNRRDLRLSPALGITSP